MKAPSQWSEWYGVTCKKSGKISSTKKTKQQRKFLIYIQKLLKINISFITSNHFSRLCPFVFVKPRSKHKYQCFLILVQSFSACTFSRIYALIVSDTNFHQFGHAFSFLNGPDKKPKQNSSKTKRHPQQQEAESVRRRTAVSQRNFFWRVVTRTLRWLARMRCLLYFLAFD